jgi:hypothetical protein
MTVIKFAFHKYIAKAELFPTKERACVKMCTVYKNIPAEQALNLESKGF